MNIQPSLAVVVENGDPPVLRLVGDFDLAGVPAARARFSELDGDVDVDCSGLAFMDSSGLCTLLAANAACDARGATLVLVDPPQCVQRLLDMTGLHTVFRMRWSGSVS